MITTIQKWGNSQGIRIPKFLLELVEWCENEEVAVKAEEGKLIIERVEKRKNIKELFEGFEGEYESVEIDWGKPEGEEIW